MKCIPAISAIGAMSLVACDTMTGPITSGGYDPLLPAGSSGGSAINRNAATTFSAGQFVRASMDNTAFFKTRPTGEADADKLLKRGTSMKVISISNSYVKVELDSGEIGYVPSVMLEDPNAVPQTLTTAPGEYQVYPPLPGSGIGQPLPALDPAGLPPEGAIPTVIDPDAPANPTAVPPVTPTTDDFAAPVPPIEPKVEATPPPSPAPV
ncbi:MAG: hypothetical protein RLZZ214_3110, partial [Verrucomicrobiota bacterium]